MITLLNKLRIGSKEILRRHLLLPKLQACVPSGVGELSVGLFEAEPAAAATISLAPGASGKNDQGQKNFLTSSGAEAQENEISTVTVEPSAKPVLGPRTSSRSSGSLATITPRPSALPPALVQGMTDKSGFARRAAAEALVEVNDPAAVELLLTALGDKDPTVRVAAIHSLKRASGQPKVTANLKRFLADRMLGIRLAAAEVLSRSQDSTLETAFFHLLKDESFEIRALAIKYLGRTRKSNYVEALVASLSDQDNDVREAAAFALGELHSAIAIEPLVLTLADEESNVRKAAVLALQKTDPKWAESEAAQSATPQLEALLDTRPSWVRSAVGQLLSQLHQHAVLADKPC